MIYFLLQTPFPGASPEVMIGGKDQILRARSYFLLAHCRETVHLPANGGFLLSPKIRIKKAWNSGVLDLSLSRKYTPLCLLGVCTLGRNRSCARRSVAAPPLCSARPARRTRGRSTASASPSTPGRTAKYKNFTYFLHKYLFPDTPFTFKFFFRCLILKTCCCVELLFISFFTTIYLF